MGTVDCANAQAANRSWHGTRRVMFPIDINSMLRLRSATRHKKPWPVPQLFARESGLFFQRLQRIVNDGTVAGAVDELPHPRVGAALSSNHVRKVAADVGAVIVDGAIVARKEHAAAFTPAEIPGIILVVHYCVFSDEFLCRDPERPREPRDIAVRHLDRRDPAAVRADRAVDLVLDLFAN